jgi:ubiquinone/menaquinone biosynthesis C-methylase UbiE
VVGDAVLSGNALLEVGSGRGGGIAFLARTLGTSRAVGVDYSEQAVRLARRLNQAPGLSYEVGDAEALPLADCSFDAVVNVESSHCYASMERFLAEVRRVLKPAGMFYWADMRPEGAIEAARRQFADAGFALVSEGEITRNVLRSLDLVSTARLARIRRGVPRFLQPALADFAGVAGTRVYESLRTGEVRYLSCTLQRDG